MDYDEDLMVELIAGGDVSQTEIAERVGVSRRTVWRIANGQSRPDLQQKIADTVEGYRRETIRLAAKFMKPILKKQIEVALEGDGETARKCREFLLKTFMLAAPEQAAKRLRLATTSSQESASKRDSSGPRVPSLPSLTELSPELKRQVVAELGGPADERLSTTEDTDVETATVLLSPLSSPTATPTDERLSTTDDTENAEVEEATATPLDKGKKVPAPFSTKVTLPNGNRVYAESIRLIEEAKAEEAALPTRRRVPRVPRE